MNEICHNDRYLPDALEDFPYTESKIVDIRNFNLTIL